MNCLKNGFTIIGKNKRRKTLKKKRSRGNGGYLHSHYGLLDEFIFSLEFPKPVCKGVVTWTIKLNGIENIKNASTC